MEDGVIVSNPALPILSFPKPIQLNGSQEPRSRLFVEVYVHFIPPSRQRVFKIPKFFTSSAFDLHSVGARNRILSSTDTSSVDNL